MALVAFGFFVVPGSGGDAGIIVVPCSFLQLASKC